MNEKLNTIKTVLAFIGFFAIGNAVLIDAFETKGQEAIFANEKDEE